MSQTKSISLQKSILDWWNSCGTILGRNEKSLNPRARAKVERAKLKNRLIEYELLRNILSDDVYIHSPESDGADVENQELTGQLLDVEIEDDLTIHELYFENNCPPPQGEPVEVTHIVIIHGYMAALGYFVKNFEQILKSKPGLRIHAIDLPGFGNSSRPPFPETFLQEVEPGPESIQQVLDVENWFIDKIEQWRVARNVTKFKLMAHSMGAYLSCSYLMKYNQGGQMVSDFMAVSPMGTEPSHISLINPHQEFTHGVDPFKELITREKNGTVETNAELEQLWARLGSPKFPKNAILRYLWESHRTPFEILQYLGPFYSKIISFWSFQRFQNLKSNDPQNEDNTEMILKLHDYSYSIFDQYQRSGELAITKLINHEILAYLPLSDKGFVEYLNENGLKVMWLYGDKDWMNSEGGLHVSEKISEKSSLSSFKIISEAGHHLYLDNPEEFNREVIKFFQLTS